MKRIFILLTVTVCTIYSKAQTVPQGMQYQAIARNLKGQILSNEPISLKVSLVTQNGGPGKPYYTETHDITTNQFGLFTLVIGGGTVVDGSFNAVPWSTQNIWLQVDIKDKGQSSFTNISNSKLLTVPYAFHAETANSVVGPTPGTTSLAAPVAAACSCKDGLASVQLLYLGNDNADIKVFGDKELKQLIIPFYPVKNGDILNVVSLTRNNKLPDEIYIQISNSSIPVLELPSGCNDVIVGETFGNFSVVSRTDAKNGTTCSVCDIKQNWKVGGNVVSAPCNWLGSLSKSDIILITNNVPRMNITADGDVNIINNLSVGKTLTVTGATNLNNILTVTGATNLNNTLGVTGITSITNTMQSNSINDGALVVKGGVGIAKNLNVGGAVNFGGSAAFGGALHITDLTESTSPSTGALIVDGGTGIGKNLNVGGNENVAGTTTLNNTLGVTGITSITNTTQSNTIGDGALVVTGGTGIGKNLNVGGNEKVTGTTTLSSTLDVTDATHLKSSLITDGTTTLNNSLTVTKSDPAFVATIINTDNGDGDGLKIKLGKAKSEYSPPALPTFSQAELDQFKDLIRCDYPGSKLTLLGTIITAGVIDDIKAMAGIAVGAGNMIIKIINDGLSLPLKIGPYAFPGFHVLDRTVLFGGLDLSPIGKIPELAIPSLDVPTIPILPELTVMPRLPSIDLTGIGIPEIPIFDLDFWGLPDICLTDAAGSTPLNNKNEFIRFVDKNDAKMGSVRAVSVSDWAKNYLNPIFLFSLRGALLSSKVDKLHAQYHFKNLISGALVDYSKLGVEYTSGNGDYAEWLERMDKNELISAGDIVGIKGGKITKNLIDVEQVMVVSSNPIMLGNAPAEDKNYQGNIIAFMGQVPVKILGPVISGDYIIGQSNTPGYGIAKHPNNMSIEDFKNAVGRSWENDETDGAKMVNTVVGVHNNSFLNVVKDIKQKAENNEARLKLLEAKVNMMIPVKSKYLPKNIFSNNYLLV